MFQGESGRIGTQVDPNEASSTPHKLVDEAVTQYLLHPPQSHVTVDDPSGPGSAFLPQLYRQTSEDISHAWSRECKVLPEYKASYDLCFLSGKWMHSAKLTTILKALRAQLRDRPELAAALNNDRWALQ